MMRFANILQSGIYPGYFLRQPQELNMRRLGRPLYPENRSTNISCSIAVAVCANEWGCSNSQRGVSQTVGTAVRGAMMWLSNDDHMSSGACHHGGAQVVGPLRLQCKISDD